MSWQPPKPPDAQFLNEARTLRAFSFGFVRMSGITKNDRYYFYIIAALCC